MGVKLNLGSSSHSLGPLWDRMGLSHIHSLYDGEPGLQAKGAPGEMSYLELERNQIQRQQDSPQDASLSKGPNPRVECRTWKILGNWGWEPFRV